MYVTLKKNETMKIALLILVDLFIVSLSFGQSPESRKQNVLRLNFINPGIEYEQSISEKSKLSANVGFGVSMSYPEITSIQYHNAFFLSPFLDIHYKCIYNFSRRVNKGKNINFNTGDFVGIKFNGRGKDVVSGSIRTGNLDFSVGPTWGVQRSFGRINLLFDLGPVYYFDTHGNSGFYPVMLELNMGYNIRTNKKAKQNK